MMEQKDMPDVLRRFLRYAQVHTTSANDQDAIPSTTCQFDLAMMLERELKEMGLKDVVLDEHCILVATIPSNLGPAHETPVPAICFIAHVDTSPEEPGENVQPRVFTYEGGTITFPANLGLAISPEELPALSRLAGQRLVTSDGTTLLGADDKAGVAEIMAAAAWLVQHPEFRHGTVKLVFTPDEEVGKGVDALDVEKLGVAYGYTVDGDEVGVIEAECFNAASGSITIQGYNVHPGYAYGTMVNASRVMRDLLGIFPDESAPETTRDRQGYLHVTRAVGSVNEAKIDFILRDFDQDALHAKVDAVKGGVAGVQRRWPAARIAVAFKEGYRNMKAVMDQNPKVVELAEAAMRGAGVEPIRKAIRGGTDGARLSFMGLPCPNLFAGGMNFHSKKELVPVGWMEKAVQVILNIIKIVSTNQEGRK
ncbi:MAG: peptidase T [Candidatus Lokiarchaeota archaeon]|nr:peptidase T [Candidatus Lokiarchaeota archaeon]